MIVSHKHKFIFLKTRRTGSSSMEFALEKICGPDDIVTAFLPVPDNYTPRNHEGMESHSSHREIVDLVGMRIWSDYLKFCFDRNPWDRMVSWYWFETSLVFPACERKSGEFSRPAFKQWLSVTDMNPNWPLYANSNNKIAVDFLGRYERMEEDWDRVCRMIGISPPPLSHINSYRQEATHYSRYYDETTKKMVAEAHKNEILFFPYKFEEK